MTHSPSPTHSVLPNTKEKGVVRKDITKLPKVEDEAVVSHSDSADLPADTSKMVEVEVPIMAYEYRDTFQTDTSRIELGIRYEGYKAKIDGIDLNYRFETQPRIIEKKKKGWGQFIGIGIGVGYGASFVGNPSGVGTIVHAAPEIGVHITYGLGYHW